jgi:hypothetical protein
MLKEILINPIENCIKEKSDKKYIIICDTLRNDFDKYIISLSKKEYAPAYTIKKNGDIHKFYDDFYYTNLTNIGVGTHTFNYPPITVSIFGNTGISSTTIPS